MKSTAVHDSSGRGKIKCLPISSMQTFWTRWIRRLVLMLIVTKASHCQTQRRRSVIQVWQDDSHDTAFSLVGWQGGMWHTWPHHAVWSIVTTSGLHRVSVGSKPWELNWASQMLAQHWHTLGIASSVSKDQMGKHGQMTKIVHIYYNSDHPDESLPEMVQWRHGSRCRVGLLANDNMVEQRGQPIAGMLRGGSANKACYKDKIQADTINSLLKSVAVKMSSHWTVYRRQGWWAWAWCLKQKDWSKNVPTPCIILTTDVMAYNHQQLLYR